MSETVGWEPLFLGPVDDFFLFHIQLAQTAGGTHEDISVPVRYNAVDIVGCQPAVLGIVVFYLVSTVINDKQSFRIGTQIGISAVGSLVNGIDSPHAVVVGIGGQLSGYLIEYVESLSRAYPHSFFVIGSDVCYGVGGIVYFRLPGFRIVFPETVRSSHPEHAVFVFIQAADVFVGHHAWGIRHLWREGHLMGLLVDAVDARHISAYHDDSRCRFAQGDEDAVVVGSIFAVGGNVVGPEVTSCGIAADTVAGGKPDISFRIFKDGIHSVVYQ